MAVYAYEISYFQQKVNFLSPVFHPIYLIGNLVGLHASSKTVVRLDGVRDGVP